jgi:hypothetical protein
MTDTSAWQDPLAVHVECLERACALRSVPLEEREAIMAALAALAAAIDQHRRGAEGELLDLVEQDAPRLTHAADLQSTDHEAFAREVTELREAGAVGVPLGELRARCRALGSAIDTHLDRSIRLVRDAYSSDPPGGEA